MANASWNWMAAQLILDTDERHRLEYSLELLMRRSANRLDENTQHLSKRQHAKKERKETCLPPS